MVTMGMGNYCLFNRLPWIDIEISGRAEQTFICKVDEWHGDGFMLQVTGFRAW